MGNKFVQRTAGIAIPLLFTGCALNVPSMQLPLNNPANPAAPIAASSPPSSALDTYQPNTMLASDRPGRSTPPSGRKPAMGADHDMKNMQGMDGMKHMEGMNGMQGMDGMKNMPRMKGMEGTKDMKDMHDMPGGMKPMDGMQGMEGMKDGSDSKRMHDMQNMPGMNRGGAPTAGAPGGHATDRNPGGADQ